LEFERLIQTVVKTRLGFGIEAWGGSGDWGRDGYLEGKLCYPSNQKTDGPFVFQCKFVENANAAGAKPQKTLMGAVQKECSKIRKNLKSRKWKEAPNCYGFFTNAPCTAALRESLRSALCEIIPFANISIHDGRDVCQWLNSEIVQSFPQLRSPPGTITMLHQLPAAPAAFTGREKELSYFKTALARRGKIGAVISARGAGIQGMGGVGKTTLATVLAHRLKDKYPDAQIYINLRGYEPTGRKPMPPSEAMQSIIHVFHPEAKLAETAEDLRGIYTAVLNDAGRVLLLLDNATNAEQLQPLLPPSTCLLLVTSRNQFHLPGLVTRNIECLPSEKSQELLLKLAPRLKGHEPTVAKLCGHLPLALEVFAGVVSEKTLHPVEELVARLRKHDEKLGKVEATFQVSYDLLTNSLRRCWTMLATFPTNFDLPACAAIWEMKIEMAREIMQVLLNRSLVEVDEAIGRFRLHDLVHQFCNGKLRDVKRCISMMRYAKHYKKVGVEANRLYLKGGKNVVMGLELFDRERLHIEAAFEWLSPKRDKASAALLASLVSPTVHIGLLRFHPRQCIRWNQRMLEASRMTKNRRQEETALGNLGIAYNHIGKPRKAITFFKQALLIACEIGDPRFEGYLLHGLGVAYKNIGKPRKAIDFYEQALVIIRKIDDQRGESYALANLGLAYSDLNEPRKTIGFCKRALAIARATSNPRSEGNALNNLGLAYAQLGDPGKALEYFEQRLIVVRKIIDRRGEGFSLFNSALALDKLQDRPKAIARAKAALQIFKAIEHPWGAKARAVLKNWNASQNKKKPTGKSRSRCSPRPR
jgi:Tfp pilus assembly protein PilF